MQNAAMKDFLRARFRPRRVRVEFLLLDLEASSSSSLDNNCHTDYVTIHDGFFDNETLVATKRR